MASHARWWREWEFWAVPLLVGVIFGSRLSQTPPNGEETRWGQVAREMITSGDWLVPRLQGRPFLSHQPLQDWAIALSALAWGKIDAVSLRFPSIVALLLTVTLTYAYSRTFLSRLGALCAVLAFATMGLVLQFGWSAETESIFTCVVAGSLIVWRWAGASGKTPLLSWCGGYGLAALAMLTKGPQGLLYFVGGVGLFLLTTRRLRELLRWQHAVGIGLFLAIWLAWELPFYLRVGPHDAWIMLTGDVSDRFGGGSWVRTLKHLVEFPVSVMACMLPWCVLLLAYLRRDFRRSIAFAREDVWYLAMAIGFASLTCYAVPGARNRYLAPILPLVAPLIGLVAQQCCAAAASEWLVRLRQRFFIGMGLVIAGLGAWFAVATALRLGPLRGEQPAAFAIVFALAALAAMATAFWASARPEPWRQRLGTLAVATVMGMGYIGAVANTYVATRPPLDTQIAAIAARLPDDVQLVSIGPVDHDFLYYYGKPVKQLPAIAGTGHKERAWTYFCMGEDRNMPAVDMPYEKLGVVLIDPANSDRPQSTVIIGRRRPEETAAVENCLR